MIHHDEGTEELVFENLDPTQAQPVTRRGAIRRLVEAAVTTGMVAGTAGSLLEHSRADALSAQVAEQRGEIHALQQREVQDRLAQANRLTNTFTALDASNQTSRGYALDGKARRAQVEAIATTVANDPVLSRDPVSAYGYARDVLKLWSQTEFPRAYDDAAHDLPLDMVTAAGIATARAHGQPTGDQSPAFQALMATTAFYEGMALDLESVGGDVDRLDAWGLQASLVQLQRRLNGGPSTIALPDANLAADSAYSKTGKLSDSFFLQGILADSTVGLQLVPDDLVNTA